MILFLVLNYLFVIFPTVLISFSFSKHVSHLVFATDSEDDIESIGCHGGQNGRPGREQSSEPYNWIDEGLFRHT